MFDADQAVAGDGSGEDGTEEMHGGAHPEDLDNMTSAIAVCVCYTYSSQRHSSMLRFTVPSSAFDDSTTLQVKQRNGLSTEHWYFQQIKMGLSRLFLSFAVVFQQEMSVYICKLSVCH